MCIALWDTQYVNGTFKKKNVIGFAVLYTQRKCAFCAQYAYCNTVQPR